jgi:hypothetical protein
MAKIRQIRQHPHYQHTHQGPPQIGKPGGSFLDTLGSEPFHPSTLHHYVHVANFPRSPQTSHETLHAPTDSKALALLNHKDVDTIHVFTLHTDINSCFKTLRRATRLLIKYARNQHRLNPGEALNDMLVKKQKLVLQSIVRIAAERPNPHILPI